MSATSVRETSRTDIEQKFKQSGITVAISNPVLSAMQNAEGMAQAIGNTSDSRMQALGAAAIGLNGYNTYNSLTDKAGNFDADKAQGVSVSISLGSSKSQSNSTNQSDTARGSTVAAGNNVSITATGAGADSNLTVQGSSVTAGNNAILAADNQVKLLAAQNTASQSSTNSSSSGSVGVSFGVGPGGAGPSFNASASKGSGQANGSDTSYTNTQVVAGNTAIVQSGGDTNLKGAVVTANTVRADVGGNLNIESLQDTSTYKSQQSSAGGSVSFGSGDIAGGGISASQSKIDSNFASVGQQSGIKAGDGGFQVSVNNNTDLKGGVIASTQAAVDNSKNSFTTGGTLTTSDIQNSASFNGSAFGVSVDVGTQPGKLGVSGVGVGIGSDKGEASSVTTAGISGIAANTAVRTGDVETGLKPIFDAAKVQREIDAQVAITQAITRETYKLGDEAYRTMFLKSASIYQIVKDEDGNVVLDANGRPAVRELSAEERLNLQPGPDGKVHVANNGIFNDLDAAATYANQHSTADTGPQYLVAFPQAENAISELLVAAYQKYLEGGTFGLTNAGQVNVDLLNTYGATGLELDGHSRGAMTIGNALQVIANQPGAAGSLPGLTIHMYGPAFDVIAADGLLGFVQGRSATGYSTGLDGPVLQYQNHVADPVGGLIGGNAATGGTVPEGSSATREAIRAATGQPITVHNCYGTGPQKCAIFWNAAFPEFLPAIVTK
ncbi:hemagglutinin repeat-containing protein [Polaromonas sp.]|uniref:hemagglutinin repeat-containing protein n=1 Tax=Polaromonas sp. TaxID=1869339 RepID=UPI00352B44FF